MYKAFEKLSAEKRKRILEAAYEEFGQKGYEQSSTNVIVENAKIGKGMLFYYFSSKEKLYDYLVKYAMDYIQENFIDLIDEEEEDYLVKMSHISQLKLTIYETWPSLFTFNTIIFCDDEDPSYGKNRKNHQKLLERIYRKIHKNLNYDLFRDDIDKKRCIRLMDYTLKGLGEDLFVAV